jgi:hypothetical protein
MLFTIAIGIQPQSESPGDSPAPDGGRKDPRKDRENVTLEMDTKGYPVLPTWKQIDGKKSLYLKCLVGAFMTEMYRS